MVMVDNAFGLSSSGLRDWLIQRLTSIIIAIYAIFIIAFILLHPKMQFDEWQMLFSFNSFKIFSFLALFSIILHGWIGMWTVFTDYIKNITLRLILLFLVAILFFCCLTWGAVVLWGS
jgi:succinate dehydrogenase / fumarate reductase, membrane anchor subunit